MYTIPVVKIDDPTLIKWLRERACEPGVTVSSTVREALKDLMARESVKR